MQALLWFRSMVDAMQRWLRQVGGRSQPAVRTAPRKKAICIGINEYRQEGSQLRGCINDATGWAQLLQEQFQFEPPKMLLNQKATLGNVTSAIRALIRDAQSGDVLVVTYSGHGTSKFDTTRDEDDQRDEAICLYDGDLIDDDLNHLFQSLAPGVHLAMVSDSCHSGSVTREILQALNQKEAVAPKMKKVRYRPPQDNRQARQSRSVPLRSKVFAPTYGDGDRDILLAGCRDNEYSYDAFLDGRFAGAMSHFAQQILRSNTHLTYEQLYQELGRKLPSQHFPQNPQLQGAKAERSRKVFR